VGQRQPRPCHQQRPLPRLQRREQQSDSLRDNIQAIEAALGKKAILELLPLQAGDIPDSFADVTELSRQVGYKPTTPVQVGVARFVDWYKQYYRE
jgi:hypothetical protein